MSANPVVVCWICGKSVSPEQYKLDEYGFPVHDGCKNVPKAEGLRDDQSKRLDR